MSLNVITFACHVLDQQLVLLNNAEFMRSLLASCGASQGLGAPRGVCHERQTHQFVCTRH
jgi:hypothetical protein